jgi:hypothetical protein
MGEFCWKKITHLLPVQKIWIKLNLLINKTLLTQVGSNENLSKVQHQT